MQNKIEELNKQLQQLKQENEKLKSDLQEETKLGHKAMCDEADMAWEVTKLQKCLDEIEELIETCNNTMYCKDCKFSENCQYRNGWDWKEIVFQLIKQAKEGGE